MENKDQEGWDKAIAHAREMLEIYKTIPAGIFGAMMIAQSINLYEQGDRSDALLESLEGIN